MSALLAVSIAASIALKLSRAVPRTDTAFAAHASRKAASVLFLLLLLLLLLFALLSVVPLFELLKSSSAS